MGDPTVTPITESRHAFGYIIAEPNNGMYTREEVVIASGSGLVTAGLVLGAILTGGVAVAAALGTNVGNGAMSAIVVTGPARAGVYTLIMVEPAANAGAFVLEDPDGVEIGHGNVGIAFAAGGLAFTLADGATDFVAGDSFTIVVTGATKYKPFDPTANDGTQVAAAILGSERRDATAADRKAVANVRGPMRVNASELVWGANVTNQPQRTAALAQLKKLGILA